MPTFRRAIEFVADAEFQRLTNLHVTLFWQNGKRYGRTARTSHASHRSIYRSANYFCL